MYTYLHQASVSKKHSRSVIVTMRVRRQAKHYAIHFRCCYGDGKTAFWVFSNLLHDPRAYVAVEIAFPTHVLFSTASSRQGEARIGVAKHGWGVSRASCSRNTDSATREERTAPNSTYRGSFKSALGYAKDPMVPIIGRIVGNGSSGFEELKETWRTGVSLMIEWMVCRS